MNSTTVSTGTQGEKMACSATGDAGFIYPDWPAPETIRALVTTRRLSTAFPGASKNGYASFNLADHTGDDKDAVCRNRAALINTARLPAAPLWLNQIHGNAVVLHESVTTAQSVDADACLTRQKDKVCAVMTADCLPVFFCDSKGHEVAVAHAGWRGLYAGILQQTVAEFNCQPQDIVTWLGPAIGPDNFEVGSEVFRAFISLIPQARSAFRQLDDAHSLCNIYQLGRLILNQSGVSQVFGGNFCTYRDNQRFYSYRRDGKTGRMASLIWKQE